MNKFPQERVFNVLVNSESFKNPIPLMYVKPIQETSDSCILLFVGGIGQTNSLSIYMNNSIFDTNYFFTYEKLGHGQNKNKPSQFKKPYLVELDSIINWIKQNFPNKKIFLLGESWGSAINLIYIKKYQNKVDGTINWNMPTKIINTQKKSFKRVWVSAWKEIATILFNANLRLPIEANHRDPLTQNEVLKRVSIMTHDDNKASSNSRLTVCVWRYFKPSKNFLIKNCNNEKYKFLYIQSGQDALINKKLIKKLVEKADQKHFVNLPTGYHILSMEPKESDQLYSLINSFIKSK